MAVMIGGIAWPHLLADLIAKRDALTDLIETVRTHFVNEADPSAMPESPMDRPRGSTPPKKRALRKQTNKQTNKQSKARTSVRAPRSLPKREVETTAPSASGATQGRDVAILARLRLGPAKFADLKAAMPKEQGLTEDQMVRACSNALTRLRMKKQIAVTKDGVWTLA